MNVDQCMTREPQSCRTHDNLERAAQIMWECDCGCVPVVDEGSKVVGMITDRDICMAAYTRGALLRDISVESVMAHEIAGCHAGDALESALNLMRSRQVRRLPVLDGVGGLLGVLSLADIVRQVSAPGRSKSGRFSGDEVLLTLSMIAHPHGGHDGHESDGRHDGRSRSDEAGVLQPKARTNSASSRSTSRPG